MGSRFAYTKATEGNYYTNPYFAQQYNGSAQSGMIRGAYHLPTHAPPLELNRHAISSDTAVDGVTTELQCPAYSILNTTQYPSLGNTCYNMSSADLTRWIRDFMETYRSSPVDTL